MSNAIRIITINGWFDNDVADEFDLPTYVMGIRAAGYILNPSTYVNLHHLVSVVLFDKDQPPPTPNQAPPGSTLQ